MDWLVIVVGVIFVVWSTARSRSQRKREIVNILRGAGQMTALEIVNRSSVGASEIIPLLARMELDGEVETTLNEPDKKLYWLEPPRYS